MRIPLLVVTAATFLLLFGLLIARRPRLLLQPVVWTFAVWTWVKTIVLLPVNVHEWLVASALEKHASALASHASAASALWSANTEFRPAAREIYARVCAGYGVFPPRGAGAHDDGPRNTPPGEDPYDAANRASASSAVQRSRGGIKSVKDPAPSGAETLQSGAEAPKS